MSVVVRVPMSATPNYLNRMVLLARSARQAGGILADARIEAFVSPDRPRPPSAWVRHLAEQGVEWIDVPSEQFAAHSYGATGIERFRQPTDAEVIVMSDADLLFVGDLTDVVERCASTGAIHGVTAYRSPFIPARYPARREMDRRSCWTDLFRRVGLDAPALTFRHPSAFDSNWDVDATQCPPYFNYGLLVLRPDDARALGESLYEEHHRIVQHFSGAHSGQLAFASAVQRLGLATEQLTIRYNFPNQEPYVDAYPDDFQDIRVLHYMSPKSFDKESDLDTADRIRKWASREPADLVHALLAFHLAAHDEALVACPWNEAE